MITEYTTGLGPGNMPTAIAAGPDGNLWFTDSLANAIGRVTPSGQITEYPNGLGRSNGPTAIAPGADGDMWFADTGADAIGRIGTGAPPALHTPATVTGAGQEGSPEAARRNGPTGRGTRRGPGCIPSTATRGSATATRSQVRQRRPTPRPPPTWATSSAAG